MVRNTQPPYARITEVLAPQGEAARPALEAALATPDLAEARRTFLADALAARVP